jgi:hypothetical protein
MHSSAWATVRSIATLFREPQIRRLRRKAEWISRLSIPLEPVASDHFASVSMNRDQLGYRFPCFVVKDNQGDLLSEDNGFVVEVFGNEWEIVR